MPDDLDRGLIQSCPICGPFLDVEVDAVLFGVTTRVLPCPGTMNWRSSRP
ncbi:hypothetical protein OOK27_01355 [Streptomyces canus]|nr:hypothetical protein [Streptomyces canus]MCX5252821.1 hypothetical protein [Streptomyces canus]